VEPEQAVARLQSGRRGVLVGRGVLRNPWILAQAADLAGRAVPRIVSLEDRGRFLFDCIGSYKDEGGSDSGHQSVRGALGSWYTKGFEMGRPPNRDHSAEALVALQGREIATFPSSLVM